MDEAMFTEFLTMLDVTDDELNKIEAYMASLESYFSDPAFLEAFTSWTERISFLEELDGVEELNQEQVNQVVGYFDELFNLVKLKPVISFIRDGQETVMSLDQLAQLEDFDYTTTDLKVTIYGTDGTLLADFIVTSEFVDYLSGIYGEIPEKLEENQKPSAPRTIKGGKLPKTATNNIPGVILGGLLAITGILMYKKVSNVKKKAA
jgi:processed acidic surface protein